MRILSAEDEERMAQTIQGLLKTQDLLSDIAADGEAGLDCALSGIYDLIILDIVTDTAQVVPGDYFLSIPPEDRIALMPDRMEETGALGEYKLRCCNGVREEGGHRIVFMDVSYISDAPRGTMGQIVV